MSVYHWYSLTLYSGCQDPRSPANPPLVVGSWASRQSLRLARPPLSASSHAWAAGARAESTGPNLALTEDKHVVLESMDARASPAPGVSTTAAFRLG